ncbi:MAG: replicative DNA helicase [Planctomycetota bacterium]
MATTTTTTPALAGDYQQPYDLEAEAALLGSLLMDNNIFGEISELVRPQSFYDSRYLIIFETMRDLYDRRQPFDIIMLKDEIQKKHSLEKIGGAEMLVAVAESVATPANAPYYARIVREKYILRQIITVCTGLLRKASQAKVDSENLLNDAEQQILEIAFEKDKGASASITDVLKVVYDTIDKYREHKGLTGLSTGLTRLDEYIGGLQPSQFIIVAGRPGAGKSSFALKLMETIGLKENKPLVLYTLEVTAEQVIQNLVCMDSRVSSGQLRKGFISNEEHTRILHSCARYHETKIFIDDTSGLSVFDLRNRVRRLKTQHDIQLVMVDYLQLMRWEDADNREREIAYVSSSLKALAKELKIPIVAMAQLSRETERRDISKQHPKPRISDLRESGALEQDADVILLLYRDEMYNPDDENVRNRCEILIGKQRNGPSGIPVNVAFLKEYFRFDNASDEEHLT